MSDELKALLELVEDEDTFVRFISVLGADWKLERSQEKQTACSPLESGAQGWENGDIGAFLEAASAWAQVADHKIWGYRKSENPWRRAADILMAGKYYE